LNKLFAAFLSRGRLVQALVALFCAVALYALAASFMGPGPLRLTPEETDYIQKKKMLWVGIDRDFKPLQFLDAENAPAGMTVDYLRLIGQQTGLEIRFVAATWNEIVEMLKAGEVDMIPDATPTPAREKDFLFTQAVNSQTSSLYVASDRQDIESLDDLVGKRVAVTRGTAVIDELLKHPGVVIVPYDETLEQLRALNNGDVDATVSYDTLSRLLLTQQRIHGIKAVGTVSDEPGCLAVRRQDAMLHAILTKAIDSIPQEAIRTIEQRWFGVPAMERNYTALLHRYRHWLHTGFAVMVSVFLWNLFLQRSVRRQFRDLETERKRYQALFESAQDMISVYKDGRIVDANQKVLDRMGYTREELIGMEPHLLSPPTQADGTSSKELLEERMRRALTGESFTMEWQAQTKGGAVLEMGISVSSFDAPDGRYLLAVGRDMTHFKRRQQEISRQAAYFQQLFENSPQGIVITDENAFIVGVNRAFEKLFGWTEEEARGRYLHQLVTHPDDRAQTIHNAYRIQAGEWIQVEGPRLRKDGSAIQISALGCPILVDNLFQGAYVIYEDNTKRRTAEEQVLRQKILFEQLFENSPQGIAVVDPEGHFTQVNAAFTKIFGYSPQDVLGKTVDQVLLPRSEQKEHAERAKALYRGETLRYEVDRERKDGQPIRVAVITYPLFDNGEPQGAYVIYNDVTARRKAERESQRQTAYFQQLFENSPQGIVITNNDHRIQATNKGFETIFGFTPQETTGHTLGELIVPRERQDEFKNVSQDLERGGTRLVETVRQRRNGSTVDVAFIAYPLYIEGQRHGAYGIYTDVTERKKAEEQVIHQAYHDRLTDLPNRAKLQERIGQAMQQAKEGGTRSIALLYLGLDRFKMINDSLGHMAGDQLLMAVAHRLVDVAKGVQTVCRVGGDEFAILLEHDNGTDTALALAQRIQSAIRRPISAGEHEIHVSLCIGVIVGTPAHERPDFMLRDAEIALHQAKQKGPGHVEVFQASMHEHAMRLLRLETDLRQALDRNELYLHYQPIVGLDANTLCGVEALIRWKHPQQGTVYPGDFIPLAEDTGLIIPLGEFALRTACAQFVKWRQEHPEQALEFVSVNLSARQFTQPNLAAKIKAVLDQTGLAPEHLHLEITETVVMENAHIAGRTLAALKDLGCRISVDDFGTGYSSLAYLHGFPLDALKVDRSFVSRVTHGEEHVEMVRTIIQLAHNLGLEVIAEGVEEEAQAGLLRALGCDMVQGYLYSRPVNAAGIEALLSAWASAAPQVSDPKGSRPTAG